MKISGLLFFIGLLIGNPSIVFGQLFELEGKITGISRDSREMSVMGITIVFPLELMIDTPTNTMSFDNPDPNGPCDLTPTLSDPCRISLIGATGIVIGNRDENGINLASSVFVEQAENVVIGTVTALNASETGFILNGTGRIRINVPGSEIGDDRFEAIVYPANEMTVFAETGYPVGIAGSPHFPETTECLLKDALLIPEDPTLPCPIKIGDFVAVEGDYRMGQDGTWYLAAHTLELGAPILYSSANITPPAIFKDYLLVGRASLVVAPEENLFSARGFATDPTTTVSLYAVEEDCTTLISPDPFIVEAVDPTSGGWRMRDVDVSSLGMFSVFLAKTSNGASYCSGMNVTIE